MQAKGQGHFGSHLILIPLPGLIEGIQDHGYKADEILFLCRTNEEGKSIISRILEYSASLPPEHRLRYNYEITSGESLLLERNPAVTFMIACLGTMLALILAIPVSWFAAHNITPYKPITYPIGRAIMTLTRSVHEIVWGLLFVSAVGLGAFPGILAVSMRSIGFISKLTAEAIEDIDPGPLEAIRATGANQFQVILYGVIPQILPVYLGNAIFQWDINIRRATIMGLVGAGGLGLTFHRQLVMYNYGGVTTVIIAILFLVGIGEIGSYYGRRAIL